MDKKISIIIVTYNSEATLEQAIMSIINQTYNNIELIIIDGKSLDKTVDIIKKYENDIFYWISETDSGIYNAMNKGIRIATGDYIEFIGSDDCLCNSTVIEKVVDLIEDDTDILSCCQWCVDDKYKRQYIYSNKMARNKTYYCGGMIPHPAMFTKKMLFTKYHFDESYRIVGDYKFFLQCYYDNRVKIKYDDLLVDFFSISGKSSNIQQCKAENTRLYKELKLDFNDDRRMVFYKRVIRKVMLLLGLMTITRKVKQWINIHFVWESHHCDNKICRWCNRK